MARDLPGWFLEEPSKPATIGVDFILLWPVSRPGKTLSPGRRHAWVSNPWSELQDVVRPAVIA